MGRDPSTSAGAPSKGRPRRRSGTEPEIRFVCSVLGTGPLSIPTGMDWGRAAAHVERHRLESLVSARLRADDRGSGHPAPLTPPHLLRRWEPARVRAALEGTLAQELVASSRAVLAAADVPSLVFKGAALVACGAYPDPAMRILDDVDLLVREADAARAIGALVSAGFRPWDGVGSAAGRAAWSDAIAFDAPDSRVPVALDLHWRTGYGRLRFGPRQNVGADAELWQGADDVRGLPAPEPHLVLVAEHLLKHLRVQTHLVGVADLVRLAGFVTDWDAVVRRAATGRWAVAIGGLLEAVRDELQAPIPREVTLALGSRRAGPRALRPSFLVPRVKVARTRVGGLVHRFRVGGSWSGAIADLRHTLLPSRGWLAARYGSGGWAPLHRARYLGSLARWAVLGGASPLSPNQAGDEAFRGARRVDSPEGHS